MQIEIIKVSGIPFLEVDGEVVTNNEVLSSGSAYQILDWLLHRVVRLEEQLAKPEPKTGPIAGDINKIFGNGE